MFIRNVGPVLSLNAVLNKGIDLGMDGGVMPLPMLLRNRVCLGVGGGWDLFGPYQY